MRRHRRRHRRNAKLRVKLRGKLRTYKSLRKLLKKKAKAFWRKSRKYHGRKRVTPCYTRPAKRRRRKGKGRKHSHSRKHKKARKGAWRAFQKKFLKRHKKGKFGARMKAAGRAWRKKHRR